MVKKDIKVKFKGNIMRPLWNKSGVDHKNKTFFSYFPFIKKKRTLVVPELSLRLHQQQAHPSQRYCTSAVYRLVRNYRKTLTAPFDAQRIQLILFL